MKVPVIQGVIARRILANWRVRPQTLQDLLPPPFRPKLVNGEGIAGICLIRLERVRPRHVPGFLGISSENAAHRIAIEWEDERGDSREGVFITRRDSSSLMNAMLGGRLFPGVHHHARFQVDDAIDRVAIEVESDDRVTRVSVRGQVVDALPRNSVFGDLAQASAFFESGAIGYSPGLMPGRYDGLELCCDQWRVQPLGVDGISSSFFEDASRFPAGSAEFDCALLMRNIANAWHGREPMTR